jgi:LPS-assembly protein
MLGTRRAAMACAALAPLLLALPLRAAPTAKSRPMLLQADEVVYDSDAQTITAQGHVEIVDEGRILLAQQVSYDQKTDKVTARGHVSMMDTKGNVAFADHVTLTDHMRNGALAGFGALIGKNGRMAAASAQRINANTIIAHYAAYTPCKICNKPGQRTPVWEVKSERIVYDQAAHRIRFHNATMDILGVPVLYTPYLSQPDPTVKYASGLLAPDIGSSTNIGYFLRAPVYIALSDSEDATLAPMISTHGGEMLEGEYRQRWNNGGMWLQPSFAYNPEGGLSGERAQTYDSLFGAGRVALQPDPMGWRLGYDVRLTNNDTYLKRYDISQLDRLTNDLFLDDNSGRSHFSITGYYFQGLRATDKPETTPYVLPLIQYSYIPLRNVGGGQFRFDFNTAAISQSVGPDSQRATAQMHWQIPFTFADGQLWTVRADVRGDIYHIDNDGKDTTDYPGLPKESHYISRAIPYVALDWRWPFIANTSGSNAIVLQPIAQLIAQPYGGNPAGLPIEDVGTLEFDDNSIFSFDHLSGYDLVESGPRANIGGTAEYYFPTGSIEALIGQTFRLKPDPIFAADSGEAGTNSDVVGRLSVKFPYIDLTDRIDIDRGNGSIRRQEIYLTGTYGRSEVQVSYVNLPPEAVTLGLGRREEVNFQADVNFYRNWQLFAAAQRDLIANQFLDTEYGLGYEDECLDIALAYRRKYTSDRDLPPSTSIILRFSLKTGDTPITPFTLFPRDVFNTIHP